MRRLILVLAAALAGGCAAHGAHGTYAVSASVGTPDLVYVSPGVYAVAGYADPIFYSNNFYWRFYAGSWYRSPYWNRGWAYYPRPPRVIARIDRPYQVYRRHRTYDRYRRPVYRDHRRYRRPVYRDHRRHDRDVRVRPAPRQRSRVIIRDRD